MKRGVVLRWAAMLLDVVIAISAVPLAFLLRVGELPPFPKHDRFFFSGLLLTFIACMFLFKLNRGAWRYVSISELWNILKVVVTTHLVWVFLFSTANMMVNVPRSIPFISAMLMFLGMSGARVGYRAIKERFGSSRMRLNLSAEPILVLGFGDQADGFIRGLLRQKNSPFKVLGIVATTQRHLGRHLHDVAVVGESKDLRSIVEGYEENGVALRKVVVATEKSSIEQIQADIDWASERGIRFLALPSPNDLESLGESGNPSPRELQIEDLLGRRHAEIDLTSIKMLLTDEVVLITGAGGSIGSELVRQISAMAPKLLVIVDNSEFNLFHIDREIRAKFPLLPVLTSYCDVRDRAAIGTLMREQRPAFVFHAAALKHVPLVEGNPLEGLHTNVLGTRLIVDLANEVGTLAFVMISTDKAVNPTNVMGASKRFAEAYCQSAGQNASKCNFITVRFGNVLGSAGSVVPLFLDQIKCGGPVTVTHADVERYFMTISEAVTLVLAATAVGFGEKQKESRIFVLEMGKPIKILDLARKMIQLAGLRPNEEIKIVFTGLRPGEKMFEEKFEANENIEGSSSPWLLIAKPRVPDSKILREALATIEHAIEVRDESRALKAVKQVVPEYAAQHPALADDKASEASLSFTNQIVVLDSRSSGAARPR